MPQYNIHRLLCEIDKIYGAKPSFSPSLNMPDHLSSMYNLRGMSIYSFRLHLDLDLGYTSRLGLKGANPIRLMVTYMYSATEFSLPII